MDKELCARTSAAYKPGEPIEGMYCSYHWTGKMPCTGEYACFLCGKRHPNFLRRIKL